MCGKIGYESFEMTDYLCDYKLKKLQENLFM